MADKAKKLNYAEEATPIEELNKIEGHEVLLITRAKFVDKVKKYVIENPIQHGAHTGGWIKVLMSEGGIKSEGFISLRLEGKALEAFGKMSLKEVEKKYCPDSVNLVFMKKGEYREFYGYGIKEVLEDHYAQHSFGFLSERERVTLIAELGAAAAPKKVEEAMD